MDSNYQSLTWRQMASYHEELRKEIFEKVESRYSFLNIKANEISYKNSVEADSWKKVWDKPNRAASWSWADLYHEYHTRGSARRFDMALSRNGGLVGLCYGMMERDRVILRLHAVERTPVQSNAISDYIDINLYAANLYARLNNTREIWICDPVSPAHTRMYQGKGYTPHENYRGTVTHLVVKL